MKKNMDLNGNGNYSNFELYSGIIEATEDPTEREKLWNAFKPSNQTKSWSDIEKDYGSIYQRTESARKKVESSISKENISAFDASVKKYGTSSRYKAYQAIMSVSGATNVEREAYYNYINAQRTSPWKASWAQMVANGGYPS